MNLLQMSFSGAVIICAVVLLRFLCINRLPKKTFLLLWGVALCRLLLPFSLPFSWSIYSLVGKNPPAMERLQDSPIRYVVPVASPEQTMPASVPATGLSEEASLSGISAADIFFQKSMCFWMLLWLGGVTFLAFYFLISYIRCLRKFTVSLPVQNTFITEWMSDHPLIRPIAVRQSESVQAPLTYGILRPMILLPQNTDWENTCRLQYVLMHEFVHVRRWDALWKLLLTAALCLHWFNPFVWVMYVLFQRDIELACDEAVVHHFGIRTRSSYARTLISMEEEKGQLRPFFNSFSKNAIEERITSIMKTKKTTWYALFLAAVLLVVIIVVFATSGASDPKLPADSVPSSRNDIPFDPPAGTDLSAAGTDTATSMVPVSEAANTDPSSARESTAVLTVFVEGLAEEIPSTLFVGDGYSLYIPDEGFSSHAPDAWISSVNEQVQFWVAHFEKQSLEEAGSHLALSSAHPFPLEDFMAKIEKLDEMQQALTDTDDGQSQFRFATAESSYTDAFGSDMIWQIRFVEYNNGDQTDTWGLFSLYPTETEEGFRNRLSAILDTFAITEASSSAAQTASSVSDLEKQKTAELEKQAAAQLAELEEAKLKATELERQAAEELEKQMAAQLAELEQNANEFTKAYLEGDKERIQTFLTEDYKWYIDIYTGEDSSKIDYSNIKGLASAAQAQTGDTCVTSVELKGVPEAEDAYFYLTIEWMKEEDGWKVTSYGMEG